MKSMKGRHESELNSENMKLLQGIGPKSNSKKKTICVPIQYSNLLTSKFTRGLFFVRICVCVVVLGPLLYYYYIYLALLLPCNTRHTYLYYYYSNRVGSIFSRGINYPVWIGRDLLYRIPTALLSDRENHLTFWCYRFFSKRKTYISQEKNSNSFSPIFKLPDYEYQTRHRMKI